MYTCVISCKNNLILSFKRDGVITIITCWLALWMVGNWVKISFLPLLLQAWMMSLDFSKGVFVAFSLTLLTSLELKICIPEYLLGLYCTNSKTPLAIRPLISYYQDFLNRPPGVVMILSFYSFKDSFISVYSLQVIKVIGILFSFIAAIN